MGVFRGMGYMIAQPLIAVVPLVVLLGLYFLSVRRFVLVVAGLWAGYVPYEYAMKLRILCSGECNIRVDLLLIYPVLAVSSLVALAIAVRAMSKRGSRGA